MLCIKRVCVCLSNSNVKKCETELQALRDSNARLLDTLQEANSSVETWKTQAAACQEENNTLKNKVSHTRTLSLTLTHIQKNTVTITHCLTYRQTHMDSHSLERSPTVDGGRNINLQWVWQVNSNRD